MEDTFKQDLINEFKREPNLLNYAKLVYAEIEVKQLKNGKWVDVRYIKQGSIRFAILYNLEGGKPLISGIGIF